jgi:hypothetical protein
MLPTTAGTGGRQNAHASGVRRCQQDGCSRVEWTTDRDYSGPHGFYVTLGLPMQPSKVFYRVEDTGTRFQLP